MVKITEPSGVQRNNLSCESEKTVARGPPSRSQVSSAGSFSSRFPIQATRRPSGVQSTWVKRVPGSGPARRRASCPLLPATQTSVDAGVTKAMYDPSGDGTAYKASSHSFRTDPVKAETTQAPER